jgi:MFS family permease
MLGLGIINPIMSIYAQDLGATMTQIGLLSSAWSISRLIFSAPVGKLSDKKSKKMIIAAGLFVYSIVSIFYVLAWDFTSLVLIRFIHGLGSAMSMPIAMAYAAELSPEGREGRYMGTMNLAMFSGMGLGPLIGGSLTDMFSLSAPFVVMGSLTALSLVFILLFLPDQTVTIDSSRERPRSSFKEILSNRRILAAFVYRAINALGRGSIMSFLSLYMVLTYEEGGLGLSATMAGLVLSTGQLSTAILQRPGGELADRFNKSKLIIVGALISVSGMALFPFTYSFWTILLARMIFSMGSALSMPALSAIAAMEGRDLGVGTTMSVLQSAMSLGMIAGPLMSGVLADLFNIRLIFFVGSGIALFGTIVFILLTFMRSSSPEARDATHFFASKP